MYRKNQEGDEAGKIQSVVRKNINLGISSTGERRMSGLSVSSSFHQAKHSMPTINPWRDVSSGEQQVVQRHGSSLIIPWVGVVVLVCSGL